MEKFSRSRLLHVVTYVQKGFFFQGICGTLSLTPVEAWTPRISKRQNLEEGGTLKLNTDT